MNVTERLARLRLPRRHPPSRTLSQYVDGELDIRERRVLEAHVRGCARCSRLLDSLAATVQALGSLGESSPTDAADSIIVALREESSREGHGAERSSPRSEVPSLTVVGESTLPLAGARAHSRSPRGVPAALRYCLRWSQLRVTVPLAVLIGLALSFINQASMILRTPIDVTTWVICAPNFVLPFLALNVALLVVYRVPRRRGPLS